MSKAAKSEPHPFEKLKAAMRQIVTVPKEEILRREAEYKEGRKAARKNGLPDDRRHAA